MAACPDLNLTAVVVLCCEKTLFYCLRCIAVFKLVWIVNFHQTAPSSGLLCLQSEIEGGKNSTLQEIVLIDSAVSDLFKMTSLKVLIMKCFLICSE